MDMHSLVAANMLDSNHPRKMNTSAEENHDQLILSRSVDRLFRASEAITSAIRLLVCVSCQSTLTSASTSRRYWARNVLEKRG